MAGERSRSAKKLKYEDLNGPQKAAILVLSLDDDTAGEILKHLDPKQLQRLTYYSSKLRGVNAETVTSVQRDFLERNDTPARVLGGASKEQMVELLFKTFPKEVAEEIAEYLETGSEEFEGLDTLKWLDAGTIASFIRNEYPQTQAIILAHLDPNQASEVLAMLPDRARPEVITRLATLDRVNPQILRELDDVIKAEMVASGATKSSSVGGVERAAEIMNYLDKGNEQAILSQIEESNPTLVETIRELMFVFEDLVGIDDRGIQTIMKEVSNDVLTLSLKTCSEELREKMLHNISQRAAQMILEELEVMGPVKLADVEHAQQEIVKIARRLEEEGKIALAKGGADQFV